ncbi:MAG: hypothetical protein IH914_05940 [candidate division Zixibacteria bacterium]|nr:hypothetical protein [candidate division Zixibacteria bacterium]
MRRGLPIALSFIFGMLLLALRFLKGATASEASVFLIDYWQIIFTFGLLVGVAAFVLTTIKKLSRREDVFYDSVLLLGAAVMPVLALWGGIKPGSPFLWMFENIQVPLQSTIFALLAFFLTSAAFRGFRARNAPSVVLLVTGLIVIIGRVPLGDFLFPNVSELVFWIREFPSSAAKSALLVGIGLGSATTSLRVIFGAERTYLGER